MRPRNSSDRLNPPALPAAEARPSTDFQFAATLAFLELEIAYRANDRLTAAQAIAELQRRGWDVRFRVGEEAS